MTDTTLFTIGADASCTDGICGEVSRVVVDPVARAVTHLVIEPKTPLGIGRLVPLDLVDASNNEVRLRCTMAEFDKLDHAEEKQLSFNTGYGTAQSLGLVQNFSQVITYDTVPVGEVAISRGDQVHATDGDIGQVQGLIIDPGDHHVTHVLLQEGHIWGRKDVAIPIAAVTGVDDGIRLNISKREVQSLPPVDMSHLKE